MSVFEVSPYVKRSFFQVIFKQFPEENAVIELNNLLATKNLLDITSSDITSIEELYKVDLATEFSLNLQEFYAVYFNNCLKNGILSKKDNLELDHLKYLMKLDDQTSSFLRVEIGTVYYKDAYKKKVSDGILSPPDKDSLESLAITIGLSVDTVKGIETEINYEFASKLIQNYIDRFSISPEEYRGLTNKLQTLGVSDIKSIGDHFDKSVNIIRKYWETENMALSEVTNCDTDLQKNEICYYRISNAKWFELKVPKNNTVVGLSTSIQRAKEMFLRSSFTISNSYPPGSMKFIQNGNVYITNKRIIFDGNDKKSQIRLDRIIEVTPHREGFVISKDAGKDPYIEIANADFATIVLCRLLKQNRS